MITMALFVKEMALMEEATHRSAPLSQAFLNRYYEILSAELDDDQFREASEKLFRDAKFFPTPGEFIAAATPLSQKLGAEMCRLGLTAVLPEAWQQKAGCVLVREMSADQQREYLAYLRSLDTPSLPSENFEPRAIAPSVA